MIDKVDKIDNIDKKITKMERNGKMTKFGKQFKSTNKIFFSLQSCLNWERRL